MINYFICNSKFNSINYLIIHLRIYHELNSIKEFVCKSPNCWRSFSQLNSFKKHLNTHYISNYNNQNINNFNLNTNQQIASLNTQNNEIINNPCLKSFIDTSEYLKQELQKHTLHLTSKWYSNPLIPRNIVQTLINDVQHFSDSIFSVLKQKMNSEVSKLNINSNTILEFNNIFDILSNSFDETKTKYYRLKLLENIGVLILPKQIIIKD